MEADLPEVVVAGESSSESSQSSNQDYNVVPILLSRLKAPTASNLARKRVISTNPAQSAKQSKATVHNEPKISPTVRIKEFPNEFLTVVNCSVQLEATDVRVIQIRISHFLYTLGA